VIDVVQPAGRGRQAGAERRGRSRSAAGRGAGPAAPIDGIDLADRISRLHEVLELVDRQPRDRPLRLSLARVKNVLPSEIVNLCLILELIRDMGFAAIALEPPPPSFMGVYLWRIGFWDLFPEYAPARPLQDPGRRAIDTLIELRRFDDLAGVLELRDRLPDVLAAAPGAPEVPGGLKTLRHLAGTVYELAENTLAHSRRLSPGRPISGYYMVQRFPNRRRLAIAVGDVGDGIPATMRAGFPELADDVSALRAALEPGVSGDEGGGNGLYLAREAACSLPGGVMTIESGAAWLRVRSTGRDDQRLYAASWPATRVSFMFSL
jgi:hypothetical protein